MVGCSARKPVYNLTVAQAHLFYANGVLVTNTDADDHCYDAVRYMLSSRPPVPAPLVRRPEADDHPGFDAQTGERKGRDWARAWRGAEPVRVPHFLGTGQPMEEIA